MIGNDITMIIFQEGDTVYVYNIYSLSFKTTKEICFLFIIFFLLINTFFLPFIYITFHIFCGPIECFNVNYYLFSSDTLLKQ